MPCLLSGEFFVCNWPLLKGGTPVKFIAEQVRQENMHLQQLHHFRARLRIICNRGATRGGRVKEPKTPLVLINDVESGLEMPLETLENKIFFPGKEDTLALSPSPPPSVTANDRKNGLEMRLARSRIKIFFPRAQQTYIPSCVLALPPPHLAKAS